MIEPPRVQNGMDSNVCVVTLTTPDGFLMFVRQQCWTFCQYDPVSVGVTLSNLHCRAALLHRGILRA